MESGIFAAGLTSLALGGAMTVIGWKALRQNRRREAARTTLLSQLAFPAGLADAGSIAPREGGGGMPAHAVTEPSTDGGGLFGVDEFRSESSVVTEALFSEPEPSGTASRRTAALAAIGVTFAIVIGAYWWFAGAEASAAAPTSVTPASDAVASATTVSVPPPVQPAPRVELLSLGHRVTPAAFVVTGQVRNQAGGAPLHDVVAVVGVMDATGRVLTTVRVPLSRGELNAGEISEFSAAASKATNVAQYRVEFQDSARAVIPHFDRRKLE